MSNRALLTRRPLQQLSLYLHIGAISVLALGPQSPARAAPSAATAGTSAAAQPELIVSDSVRPPLLPNQAGLRVGVARSLLEHCLPATQHAFTFKPESFQRKLSELTTGDIDMNVLSYSPDRATYLIYGKEPLFTASYQPFVRVGSKITITKIQDFDSLVLGHMVGLSYSPEFNQYVEARRLAGRLDTTDTPANNVRKLAAGRIDVFVDSAPGTLRLIQDMGLASKVEISPYIIRSSQYFAVFSRKSKRFPTAEQERLLAQIDGCLHSLKTAPIYATTLAAYGYKP